MNNQIAKYPTSEQVFSLYETACVVVELLPLEITEYYQKLSSNQNIIAYMTERLQEWVRVNGAVSNSIYSPPKDIDITTPSLINLTCYELCTSLSQDNKEIDALDKYKQLKRSRKKYLYTQLREEMGELPIKPKNKRFLESEWNTLNNPYVQSMLDGQYSMHFSEVMKNYPSKESYMESRYSAATSWYKNKDSYLFQFPFFESLPEERRFVNFTIELVCSCLSVICKDFYRNKFGFVTRTLNTSLSLTNFPLFSWQSNIVQLDYEVVENKIQVFEKIDITPQHTLKFIVYEDVFDGNDALKAFNSICAEMNGGNLHRALDTFDLTILTTILNNVSFVSRGDHNVKLNFMDFARDVYGNSVHIRARDCEKLIRHVIKLGRIRISTSSTTDKGVIMLGGGMSFFDYMFKNISPSMSEMDNICTTINIASGDAKLDFSTLRVRDYELMEITFYLSASLYNMWSTSMHTYINSTMYRQIDSSKGKALLQMLQEERVRAYPELTVFIPIARFKEHFKINSSMVRFRSDLSSELESLRANVGVVESFEISTQGALITFAPLSTAEKSAYKI